MMSGTIEISEQLHATLVELAALSGVSVEEVLERAVDRYRRESMAKASKDSYDVLLDGLDGDLNPGIPQS